MITAGPQYYHGTPGTGETAFDEGRRTARTAIQAADNEGAR